MTIEEWRKVTDKLSTNNLNDLTLAAAYLQEYYGKDNEYSKRLMDVYSQIVDIKLDLLTQLIKEHPNEKELELLFSEEKRRKLQTNPRPGGFRFYQQR